MEYLTTSPGYVAKKFLSEFDDPFNPLSFRGMHVTGGKRELEKALSH